MQRPTSHLIFILAGPPGAARHIEESKGRHFSCPTFRRFAFKSWLVRKFTGGPASSFCQHQIMSIPNCHSFSLIPFHVLRFTFCFGATQCNAYNNKHSTIFDDSSSRRRQSPAGNNNKTEQILLSIFVRDAIQITSHFIYFKSPFHLRILPSTAYRHSLAPALSTITYITNNNRAA